MKKLKVKATEGFTPQELEKMAEATKKRIKEFIVRQVAKDAAFPYCPRSEALKPLKIPAKFWKFRHVCMNCGDVQEMTSYPIAQIARGLSVSYECGCGRKTKLPQQ